MRNVSNRELVSLRSVIACKKSDNDYFDFKGLEFPLVDIIFVHGIGTKNMLGLATGKVVVFVL